ncbi:MMPL family transporter [Nocardioides sp. B-3]|uniref:MMPL family transporter n=1 Tax=Nocardioides sp. B-3 TaxID=2895565 RepID=UPI0021524C3E|nr:MMPL family transporter [Nocardioides sp. B-3]UUZ61715.1 MMPL family transporter [Nocardioides sp. B-3]
MTRVREETMHLGTLQGITGRPDLDRRRDHQRRPGAGGHLPRCWGRSRSSSLAQLGVAVALGVILDTMIVRSVPVTAINMDLGGKIWWPSKLDSDDHRLTTAEIEAPIETVH